MESFPWQGAKHPLKCQSHHSALIFLLRSAPLLSTRLSADRQSCVGILRLCDAKRCRDLHGTWVPANGVIPAPHISVLPYAAAAVATKCASYQHRLGCMVLGSFLVRGWSLAGDFATNAVGWAKQSFHIAQWDFACVLG